MTLVSYNDFQKLELKIGKILSAEPVEGSEKLIRLQVDIGEAGEQGQNKARQIIAGIAKFYPAETLVGRLIVVVANLEPRTIMGLQSQGMLLAADAAGPVLLVPDKEVIPGNTIR